MASCRRMPLRLISVMLMLAVAGGAAGACARRESGGIQPAYVPSTQAQPAADPEPVPKPPAQIPARILATGDLDFPFLAFETFGPGRIALAAPAAGGKVAVLVAIASFAAGDVTGHPTLAVSFKGNPSYLELFDSDSEGLAITPLGQWVLYGLD